MTTIELRGSQALQTALADLGGEIRQAVGGEIAAIAAEAEAGIKLKIQQGSKSGRIYTRGKRAHQASAPGESPASDTGALLGSIYSERETDLTYTVGSRAVYAAYLEYGTRKMAERPFFRPVVDEITLVFEARMANAVAEVLR